MRRGDVLEILDGHGRQDSGFDSGLGSQSLSASRSEGKIRFVVLVQLVHRSAVRQSIGLVDRI